MIPEARRRYNAAFTPTRYQEMLADIDRQLPGQLDFRVAESPVFVPAELRDKLIAAGESIIDVIGQPDFQARTEAAIPAHQRVPGPEGRPRDADAVEGLLPQRIEQPRCHGDIRANVRGHAESPCAGAA